MESVPEVPAIKFANVIVVAPDNIKVAFVPRVASHETEVPDRVCTEIFTFVNSLISEFIVQVAMVLEPDKPSTAL
jgi:hypothetical protein